MSAPTVGVLAVGALGAEAPSFRVRTRIPAAELGRHGLVLRHLPLFTADEDRRFHTARTARRVAVLLSARRRLARALDAADGEVALVQRQVDLLPRLALERRAGEGRRLVLDVDDAIWLDRSPEAGGHRLAALKGTPRKVRWLARRADAVVAGNELLAEWLGRYSAQVEVVPSLVEHRDVPVREHEARERVVLGWIGSASTARELARLAAPLRRLADDSAGRRFELLIVGGDPVDVPGMDVRSEPWSEARERRFLREVDIGLMPLADTPWARGKCSYKALQYMAAGIPVVADDVGVSAGVIGDRHGGLIARGPDEWREALAALAGDPALRGRLGAAGRERVAVDYSVERWAPRLARILRGGAT
jgi:glycosyltransferase involved in cell wall biosynthesis